MVGRVEEILLPVLKYSLYKKIFFVRKDKNVHRYEKEGKKVEDVFVLCM